MKKTVEEVGCILGEIYESYSNRSITQADLATVINKKYNVNLTAEDISHITTAAGFTHTIKRDFKQFIAMRFDTNLKRHMGLE